MWKQRFRAIGPPSNSCWVTWPQEEESWFKLQDWSGWRQVKPGRASSLSGIKLELVHASCLCAEWWKDPRSRDRKQPWLTSYEKWGQSLEDPEAVYSSAKWTQKHLCVLHGCWSEWCEKRAAERLATIRAVSDTGCVIRQASRAHGGHRLGLLPPGPGWAVWKATPPQRQQLLLIWS